MSETVYIGIGTNTGNRFEYLKRAVHALEDHLKVIGISSLYETEPWGYRDQPRFYNLALQAETDLAPEALLDLLKRIESDLGRVPTFRYGPRVIDLDILLYGNLVLETERLIIPHPRMSERAFVLAPLQELAGPIIHPVVGKTILSLASDSDGRGLRLLYEREKIELVLRKGLRGFRWGTQTYLMGILNVTPDSFSHDGLLDKGDSRAQALRQAEEFIAAGAHILDIGGESTRPGAHFVPAAKEIARVVPVIKAIRALDPAVLISVDTYKPEVAVAAMRAGANWLNDVWALAASPEMPATAATLDCPVILMHNRSKPSEAVIQAGLGGHYVGPVYDDLISDISRELLASADLALAAGVRRENIILDPGIGFGKTVDQNLQLIDQLDQLKALGYPLLLAASRKSFIGYTLNLPPEERAAGTAAAVCIGIDRGADLIRVHDVAMMSRVIRMTDAIVRRS